MSQAAEVSATPKRRRRRRLPWRWLILAAVILAVGAGVWVWRARTKSTADSGVRTADVKIGNLVQTISSTGQIAAETGADVKIGSQVSGRIKHLYVGLGDQVQAGQVVAEIDAPDLAATLQGAQRSSAQAQVRYQQQLAGVGMLHTQLSNAFEQASQGIQQAEAQRTQAQAALASTQNRLKSAQASAQLQPEQTSSGIDQATAALSTARSNLKQTQAGTDLQIASSEAALRQAQLNASLAQSTLGRQEELLAKGYVAQQDVDNARNQQEVAAQQVVSAQSALALTREKVAADLQTSQNQVTQAEASLRVAQAGTYQNVISGQNLLSAQQDVASARAQLASAESQVRNAGTAQQTALGNLTQDQLKQQDVRAAYEAYLQSQSQIQQQQVQFDKSIVHSLGSGTVVALTQQEGETIAASLSAPTLMEVVDLRRLNVQANVDETDIAQVTLGQVADVTVDAFPDLKLTGKVVKISSAATLQNNVVTYLVTVALDSYPVGSLKPQMTANMTLTIKRADNVLLVPNEALKQKKEGTQVAVLSNGKAEARTVTIGMTDGTNTEVSSGLQEGEHVVLAGFELLGLPDFASIRPLPGFMNRSPLGIGGGGPPPGGGGRGGGGGGH